MNGYSNDNTILILGIGGLGLLGVFLFKDKLFGSSSVDTQQAQQQDLMIAQQLAAQQASANANFEKMMQIVSTQRASAPDQNPWTNPQTIAQFAQIGVQLAGTIASFF